MSTTLITRARNSSSSSIGALVEADSVNTEQSHLQDKPAQTQAWQKGSNTASAADSARTNRLVVFLASLPICLAAFAFILHLRGEEDAFPSTREPHLPGWRSNKEQSLDEMVSERLVELRKQAAKRGFPHSNWKPGSKLNPFPKLVFTTTTAAGVDQIVPWILFHRAIGISHFFLFVEGQAAKPQNAAVLQAMEGVTVIFRTKELEDREAHSRAWNETWLAFFFYKPCNYELFVRQSLNMEVAIERARLIDADWIFHVDTDELLHPAGTASYSLQELVAALPPDVDTIVFPNYESAVERDDIQDPFLEVSLFKKNYDHVQREAYFAHYRDAAKGNTNYFLTYGNGKSGARMQPSLRSNGAHRWHNYAKPIREEKLTEAAVLHYTYAKFSDVLSRRSRCSCKPNKEDVKRCFMLDFDRAAFIVASTQTEDQVFQWYKEHVVWTDREVIEKLLKKGIFGRIHVPQVIMRGLHASGAVNRSMEQGRVWWRRQQEQDRRRREELAAAQQAELLRALGDASLPGVGLAAKGKEGGLQDAGTSRAREAAKLLLHGGGEGSAAASRWSSWSNQARAGVEGRSKPQQGAAKVEGDSRAQHFYRVGGSSNKHNEGQQLEETTGRSLIRQWQETSRKLLELASVNAMPPLAPPLLQDNVS